MSDPGFFMSTINFIFLKYGNISQLQITLHNNPFSVNIYFSATKEIGPHDDYNLSLKYKTLIKLN